MKKLIFCTLILSLCIAGCAATLSKDMQLANQGFASLSKGNYAEAEQYLGQALAENPNNPYALLNMGVVYQNTERKPQAREMYQKLIKLNPPEVASRSNEKGGAGKTLVDIAKDNLEKL